MKKVLGIVIISFVTGMLGAYTYFTFIFAPAFYNTQTETIQVSNPIIERPIVATPKTSKYLPSEDFVAASKSSTSSVVYIKNISERRYASSWMDTFFGGGSNSHQEVSSGSGVIFTKDGFIEFMKSQGKLGGQNKLPRLSNDRKIANELINYRKND